MPLTVLFDLDDTLLINDIEAFVPEYLKTLGKHLSDHVAPDLMITSLLAATKTMLRNNTPQTTLEGAFDRAFYPKLGKNKEELRPYIEQYYTEIYPGLHYLTARRPETPALVEQALGQGHQVIVATNPLFPRKAIYHRLRWAGLDPESLPFSIITTYEDFHFAKPNPAYYAEILAQLGHPNQPAVMVGNSLEDDLIPANRLGMPVYWVTPDGEPLPAGFHPLSASGSLAAVSQWLEQVNAAGIRPEPAAPAVLPALLKATPAALDTIAKRVAPRQWRERPEDGEWSLTEIFCHLRDVDREVNIPRFEKVIHENNPFVAGIDTDPWAEARGYREMDGPAALRDFIEVRSQMAAMLEALAEEEWRRTARHAIFGPTNLTELVSFVSTHDRSHIQQVIATLRKLA